MDYCTLDAALMENERSIIPDEDKSVLSASGARKAEILVKPPAEKPKVSRGSHLVFTMIALYLTIIADLVLKLLSRARGALRL